MSQMQHLRENADREKEGECVTSSSRIGVSSLLLHVHAALPAQHACVTAENEQLRSEREQQKKYTENLQGSLEHYAAQNEKLTRCLEQATVEVVEGERH